MEQMRAVMRCEAVRHSEYLAQPHTASTFSLVQTQQTRKSCGNCFVLNENLNKKNEINFLGYFFNNGFPREQDLI